MADYAANYTARYRLKYIGAGKQHHMTFRGANVATVTSGAFVARISAFLDAIAIILDKSWAIVSADVADVNSDIFVPTDTIPVITAAKSTAELGVADTPNFISFVGRTAAGGRSIIYVYGVVIDDETTAAFNYRINPTELATIDTAILQLKASPQFLGNDGAVATWYNYANFGKSAYWQRKARQ